MILPDHNGCDTHGSGDMALYRYRSGRIEKRCLACRRERANATHNNGDRCKKSGHLKTVWTWRYYGPKQFGRCLLCQYERQRQKKALRC